MRRRKRLHATVAAPPPMHYRGGDLTALSSNDLAQIVSHAFKILASIGMAGLTGEATDRAIQAGAWHRDDGRICFPEKMIEDALDRAPKRIDLPGFLPERDLKIGGQRVHIGTGGAAVQVLDARSQTFRDSRLSDLTNLLRRKQSFTR